VDKKFKIYVMKDPDTGEVRYVGMTSTDLLTRLIRHITGFGKRRSRVRDWILPLLPMGKCALMELIEEVDEEVCDEREKYWIKFYREQGCSLLNRAHGGRHGGSGGGWTIPYKPNSPEHIEKVRTALTGKKRGPQTEEHRNKISEALKGREFSEETRNKISEANRRRVHTEESRANSSAAHLKRQKPPLERIMEKSYIDDDGCWIWDGGKTENGYPVFTYQQKRILVRRFIYEAYVGELFDRLNVKNTCKKVLCFNPVHLFTE
jgi:hypothetical protein